MYERITYMSNLPPTTRSELPPPRHSPCSKTRMPFCINKACPSNQICTTPSNHNARLRKDGVQQLHLHERPADSSLVPGTLAAGCRFSGTTRCS